MKTNNPVFFYDPKDTAGLGLPGTLGHDPEVSAIIEVEEKTIFHIGEFSGEKPADTIKCKFCGGTEFNVGIGDFYTAIRCKNCEWEFNIHQG